MKKIVVIEDDPDLTKIIVKKLKDRAYEVVTLKNGFEAMYYVKSTAQPHAVILDMMVPYRDGLELLSMIKSLWQSCRIFIFSAHADYIRRIPYGLIERFFLKTDGVDVLLDAIGREEEFSHS